MTKRKQLSPKEIFKNSLYKTVFYLFLIVLMNLFMQTPRVYELHRFLFLAPVSIAVFFFTEIYYREHKENKYLFLLLLIPAIVFILNFLPHLVYHRFFWIDNLIKGLTDINLFVKSILALIPVMYLIKPAKKRFRLVYVTSLAIILFVNFIQYAKTGFSSGTLFPKAIFLIYASLGLIFLIFLLKREKWAFYALSINSILPIVAIISIAFSANYTDFYAYIRWVSSSLLVFIILGIITAFSGAYLNMIEKVKSS